jgi:hypothetical protein
VNAGTAIFCERSLGAALSEATRRKTSCWQINQHRGFVMSGSATKPAAELARGNGDPLWTILDTAPAPAGREGLVSAVELLAPRSRRVSAYLQIRQLMYVIARFRRSLERRCFV